MHMAVETSVPEFVSPKYPYPNVNLPHSGRLYARHPAGFDASFLMVSHVHEDFTSGQHPSSFARDSHMPMTRGVLTRTGASPLIASLFPASRQSFLKIGIHDSSPGDRIVGLILPTTVSFIIVPTRASTCLPSIVY